MTLFARPSTAWICFVLWLSLTSGLQAQTLPSDLHYVTRGVPVAADSIIQANDNHHAAGSWGDDVYRLNLEVRRGVLYPTEEGGPGVRAEAFAEVGASMMIPAPLIRIPEGTRVRASVRNALPDSTITLLGFASRPIASPDSVRLAPGESATFDFETGESGTYMYRAIIGGQEDRGDGERHTAAGAFIVDPASGRTKDRVFVINIWSQPDSTAEIGGFEALLINGKSFPGTERLTADVGIEESWHVINASGRGHPMHLHGFFFDVLSTGTVFTNVAYPDSLSRHVVTEFMRRQTTMTMRWTPQREGSWLFHCHLSFHVAPEVQLPDLQEHHGGHMAGLVMGIDVRPGESDLIERGEPRHISLHALQFEDNPHHRYSFAYDAGFNPDSTETSAPGPVLFLKQYQPTFVTVSNHLTQPAGVHWHGLELDAWADGVPEFSASDGKMSPAIAPGESFTYKLTLMRPGTFMYHSHLNDIDQLAGGLYGAIVVLAEDDTFDPVTDHVYMWGMRNYRPRSFEEAFGANGSWEQPTVETTAGTTHRIRLAVMAPVTEARLNIMRDGEPYPFTAFAKDGADLPRAQRTVLTQTQRFHEGETADFLFTPEEPGTYEVLIGPQPGLQTRQTWVVTAAASSSGQ